MTDVYWLDQAEGDVPSEDGWLSEREAALLSGLRVPKRRADWRLGRWTAKHALARCLKLPTGTEGLKRLEILPAQSGAPEAFLADKPAGVRISLSHRAGTAICAVTMSEAAMGCDLELIEPHSFAFTADYFTTEEQVQVSRSSVPDRPRLIALIWSAKESALKALRTGLRLDTRCVSVSPGDAAHCWGRNGLELWLPLKVRYAGGEPFHGWWRQTGNFLLTLVAAPPPGPPTLLVPFHVH